MLAEPQHRMHVGVRRVKMQKDYVKVLQIFFRD